MHAGILTETSPPLSENVLGVIAPHAGYTYSGAVAGAVYGRIRVPDTVVVLAVNHRGTGAPAAIMSSGHWETPLGRTRIQEDFAARLKKNAGILEEDPRAHAHEHSLEMHLPFLQYRNARFELVPVCLRHLRYPDDWTKKLS